MFGLFSRARPPKDMGGHKGETFTVNPDQLKSTRLEGVDTFFATPEDFFKDRDMTLFTEEQLKKGASETARHLNRQLAEHDGSLEPKQLARQLRTMYGDMIRKGVGNREGAIGKLGRDALNLHHDIYSESLRRNKAPQATPAQEEAYAGDPGAK